MVTCRPGAHKPSTHRGVLCLLGLGVLLLEPIQISYYLQDRFLKDFLWVYVLIFIPIIATKSPHHPPYLVPHSQAFPLWYWYSQQNQQSKNLLELVQQYLVDRIRRIQQQTVFNQQTRLDAKAQCNGVVDDCIPDFLSGQTVSSQQ